MFSSDSESELFQTQNTFRDSEPDVSSDTIVEDILNMEESKPSTSGSFQHDMRDRYVLLFYCVPFDPVNRPRNR